MALIPMRRPPNKPEPTPVGAVSSAFADNVIGPAWFSFFH